MTNEEIGKNIKKVRTTLLLPRSKVCALLHKSIKWLLEREQATVEITVKDLFIMAVAWGITSNSFLEPCLLCEDIVKQISS